MFIDLHTHLRGTIDLELGRELAQKNNVRFPETTVNQKGEYVWNGFQSFLSSYDLIAKLVQTPDDLHQVAVAYLRRMAAEGTLYVEFMLSPLELEKRGIPYNDQLCALESGIGEGQSLGVESRIIATCVRHKGPTDADATARMVSKRPHPFVVGFGLVGDELAYSIQDFSAAFSIAKATGLGATAHVGEYGSPQSIEEAVECLKLDRIGHGVRAVESVEMLRTLSYGPPLEVCISSNLALGVFDDLGAHPLPKLLAAGCKVTLASDDPAFFRTTPAGEYGLAKTLLGSEEKLKQISLSAVDAAFCDEKTRSNLRERVAKAEKAQTRDP